MEAMTEGEKAEVLPKFSSESRINNYLIPVGNHRVVLGTRCASVGDRNAARKLVRICCNVHICMQQEWGHVPL